MQIKFLGAAQEVTGSCFLVDTGSRRVLVDCGLIQGDPKHEARNRSAFPFAARSVDAVVLSHAHLDHSGRLPLLVKAGFSGPIYTHAASRDLCRIMLRDAALLNERDTEWENRKRARKGHAPLEPLYTRADADAAMRRFRTVPYGADTEILPGVSLRLCDAGHILGSAIVQLRVATNSQRKTVVFSGDLGHAGAPILRDPQRVTGADLVVLESTYGDRNHRSWDATWAELAQVFNNTERIRGNILIPAFAVGRSQEILYIMKQHYREWRLDRWRVFLDSPMAIEATEVYSRHWVEHDQDAARLRRGGNPFALPNLHITRMGKIDRIHDYLQERMTSIESYQQEHSEIYDSPLDGPQITNTEIFRRYIVAYLKSRPDIYQEGMPFLVRTLAPTPTGLPIELYIFTRTTQWEVYEHIQSEIFDHLMAAASHFDLRVFQEPTGMDFATFTRSMAG